MEAPVINRDQNNQLGWKLKDGQSYGVQTQGMLKDRRLMKVKIGTFDNNNGQQFTKTYHAQKDPL